jgi:hypothetical protein
VRELTGVPLPLRPPLALALSPELAVRIDAWTFDPLLDEREGSLLGYLRSAVGM